MSVHDCHNKIMELFEKNNITTPEEFMAFFYNDGTMREEISRELKKAMDKESTDVEVELEPTDLSDFSKLSDDELYDEMGFIVFGRDDLNENQRICLVAHEFEMEFANGGVAQYFANTRGEHVVELADCLKKIGAVAYAEKCSEFILRHNISADDFSKIPKRSYWKKAESMYPYEELENDIMVFYYDDPLSKYIVDFVRANEEDFKTE